jgi:hypothetical protein
MPLFNRVPISTCANREFYLGAIFVNALSQIELGYTLFLFSDGLLYNPRLFPPWAYD